MNYDINSSKYDSLRAVRASGQYRLGNEDNNQYLVGEKNRISAEPYRFRSGDLKMHGAIGNYSEREERPNLTRAFGQAKDAFSRLNLAA